jgi:hypothetical protein
MFSLTRDLQPFLTLLFPFLQNEVNRQLFALIKLNPVMEKLDRKDFAAIVETYRDSEERFRSRRKRVRRTRSSGSLAASGGPIRNSSLHSTRPKAVRESSDRTDLLQAPSGKDPVASSWLAAHDTSAAPSSSLASVASTAAWSSKFAPISSTTTDYVDHGRSLLPYATGWGQSSELVASPFLPIDFPLPTSPEQSLAGSSVFASPSSTSDLSAFPNMLADTYFASTLPGVIPEPTASIPWLFADGIADPAVSSVGPGPVMFQTAQYPTQPVDSLPFQPQVSLPIDPNVSRNFAPVDQPPGFSKDIVSILTRYFGQGNGRHVRA